MAANINSFLNNFTGGGARANRYEVIIGFPTFLGITNVAIQQKISFTCTANSIPAATIGEATVPYKGRTIKLPGDRTFENWNVTILIDNDFLGRDVFERWVAGMLGNTSNLVNSPTELNPVKIFGQAQIHLLDRSDRVIKRYTCLGMFPSNVSEVTLGYSENDAVMTQNVVFSLNEWTAADANGRVITN